MMTRMLRLLLIFLACAGWSSAAQGADRRYPVTDFDRVIVEGPYSVTLTVGPGSSAVAHGSIQALDAVTVEVQGTTLRIRRNRSAWGGTPGQPAGPVTITLATRNLRSARVIGTGTLAVAGARGLKVEFSVEGNGHMRATSLAADTLTLATRGSGSFELQGEAKVLTADIQGSGSLTGTAFTADTGTISAATSGSISLAARRAIKIVANGLGDVAIGGAPACTINGPGAAAVRCGGNAKVAAGNAAGTGPAAKRVSPP